MKKENRTNKNLYQIIMVVAISIIVVMFIINSNDTIALQEVQSEENGNQTNSNEDPILVEAVAYYSDKVDTIDTDEVEAVKKNFGCHFEIYVYNNGELDMKLSYSGGTFYEL